MSTETIDEFDGQREVHDQEMTKDEEALHSMMHMLSYFES
jgi:hypothetical protein